MPVRLLLRSLTPTLARIPITRVIKAHNPKAVNSLGASLRLAKPGHNEVSKVAVS
jgi:hypothetical protein